MKIKLGIYRHFRGALYRVLHVARHHDEGPEVVIYESLRDGEIWYRPVDEFTEFVNGPEGSVRRFTSVEEGQPKS